MSRQTILLNGDELTNEQVIEIACNHARIEIDTGKLSSSLNYIAKKVEDEKIVYGVTTGFGSNADKKIDSADALTLQENLLRSHACGVGNNFSVEVVRAIMAIRLNTLLKGYSGVKEDTVQLLKDLLNNDVHPVIPEQGSVGASGDLCPLSHMALPLIGEGEVSFTDENGQLQTMPCEVFRQTAKAASFGYQPVKLGYKEGLALNNGTTVMAAVGVLALHKAERILKVGTLISALIYESLCVRKNFYAYKPLHLVRNHSGQTAIADWLDKLLKGSKLVNISQNEILGHLQNENLIDDKVVSDELSALLKISDEEMIKQIPEWVVSTMKARGNHTIADILVFARKKWKPQDSYSIRCVPQVFGASKTAIDHAYDIVANELNAAVDNPLIFPDEDKVISGGNFHGQPIALVMDYLKLAVAEIGNIVERQVNKLVDANTNDGLPSFLVKGNGINNGLMISQYAAAGIVSENKVLVHPASADSIPTCENTEDHVSMGTIAARQALQIADNVEKILAIAALAGFYAVTLRLEQFENVKLESARDKRLSPATLEFYNAIRKANPRLDDKNKFLNEDRFLSPEIKALQRSLADFEVICNKYLK